MTKRIYTYSCDSCGSTKTIIDDTERTGQPHQVAPGTLVCGWRGCEGTMSRAGTRDVQPTTHRDGPWAIEEARGRYHTDIGFRVTVDYAVMFALAEKVVSVDIDHMKLMKDRMTFAAALAVVLREKETGGA